MLDTDLYQRMLGLEEPWFVNKVNLLVTESRMDIIPFGNQSKAPAGLPGFQQYPFICDVAFDPAEWCGAISLYRWPSCCFQR